MPALARDVPPTPVRLRIRAVCFVADQTLTHYFRGDRPVFFTTRERIESALRQLGLEHLITPEPPVDSPMAEPAAAAPAATKAGEQP